jgi:hypothetical protein
MKRSYSVSPNENVKKQAIGEGVTDSESRRSSTESGGDAQTDGLKAEEIFASENAELLQKCKLSANDPGVAFQYGSDQQIHDALGLGSCPPTLIRGATPFLSSETFKEYIKNRIFAIIPATTSGVLLSDPAAPVVRYASNIFQHMTAANFARVICDMNSVDNMIWGVECIQNDMTCGVFLQVSENGLGKNQVDRICPLGPLTGM